MVEFYRLSEGKPANKSPTKTVLTLETKRKIVSRFFKKKTVSGLVKNWSTVISFEKKTNNTRFDSSGGNKSRKIHYYTKVMEPCMYLEE